MKNWYKSKTIWVGILEIIAGIITAVMGLLQTGAPLTITGILTIIFRVITREAVRKDK